MLKAKDGKLISLNKADQDDVFEAFLKGGCRIRCRFSYADLRGYFLTVSDSNDNEVMTFLDESSHYIIRLTDRKLHGNGMELKDFIRKYCPAYADKIG